MRPAASSQPLSSLSANTQTFTYDLPEDEPDLNMQLWHPDYSYTTPEGTGVQVKLPADTSSVSAQTSGKPTAGFSAFVAASCK